MGRLGRVALLGALGCAADPEPCGPGEGEVHADTDGDGFGDPATATCAPDGLGYLADATDCDDDDPAAHPGALEDCADADLDCDGDPTGGAADVSPWHPDTDGDGFGADATVLACTAPAGHVAATGDCDDADSAVFPAAPEACDGVDSDCDGEPTSNEADTDGDGHRICAGDCDDGDDRIHPGAPEICDGGIDDDCDPATDEDLVDGDVFSRDDDGDGWGGADDPVHACAPPAGYGAATDCDDGDPVVHPGASERCGGGDENCDDVLDDGAIDAPEWFADVDGDGFGGVALGTACEAPFGAASAPGDCDDTHAAVFPGAFEACDGIENDCDGAVPPNEVDADGDGWFVCDKDCDDGSAAVHPGHPDVCDGGIDDDCDPRTVEDRWYPDDDQDGVGDIARPFDGCTPPPGYVQLPGDCDDADPTKAATCPPHPGEHHVITEVWGPSSPQTVRTADLDGDGDPDLVWADSFEVGWIENLGSWTFGPARVVTSEASTTEPADIDGDGDLDLFVVTDPGNEDAWIGWVENLGGGAFGVFEPLANLGPESGAPQAVDVDGDGDADAVVQGPDLGVVWVENLGGGSFQLPVHVFSDSGFGTYAAHPADLDGDGDVDLICGGSDDLAWCENTGSGFGGCTVFGAPSITANDLTTADPDLDGDLDVLYADWVDGLLLFENLGGGGLAAGVVVGTVTGGIASATPDLDGDGDDDLLLTTTLDGTVWLPVEAGAYGPPIVLAATTEQPQAVAAADLDLDGDIDVFAMTDEFVVIENLGGGTFAPLHALSGSIGPVRAVDLDLDGDDDLAAIGTQGVLTFENTGDTFGPQRSLPLGEGAGPVGLAPADIDSDGVPDLVSWSAEEVVWHRNLGGFTFEAPAVVASGGERPLNAAVGDVDGDSDVDVVILHDEGVDLVLNTGAGFAPAIRPANLRNNEDPGRSIAVADLDGDGIGDPMYTYLKLTDVNTDHRFEYAVWLDWRPSSGGGWAHQLLVRSDASLYAYDPVQPHDVDLDGDLDLVHALPDIPGGAVFRWLPNLGGSFGAAVEIGPYDPEVGSAFSLADLDLDLDFDLVLRSAAGLSVYENRPGEAFATFELADTPFAVYAVVPTDVDGDSDVDLVGSGADGLLWWENPAVSAHARRR